MRAIRYDETCRWQDTSTYRQTDTHTHRERERERERDQREQAGHESYCLDEYVQELSPPDRATKRGREHQPWFNANPSPALSQTNPASQLASQTNRVARGLPWGRAGKCSADRGLGAVFVYLDSVSQQRTVNRGPGSVDGGW